MVPDERISHVVVEAESNTAATLLAAQVVGSHCTMVTSSRLVERTPS